MSVALILAAHGSHLRPHTAGIVWDYVDRLRQRGVADEITATFWKEQPAFAQVLHTVQSETVVVVPLFSSSGFFVNQIIPAEMELTGATTQRDGRTIHYTPTIGAHPNIESVVLQRVQDVRIQHALAVDDTAVTIIGHGTPRSPRAQDTITTQVERLRQHNTARDVLPAYLEDEPDIPSIYARTTAKTIVAVPFFLSYGAHAMVDVPQALGIDPDMAVSQVRGRTVHYTPPIGTADVIIDFVLQTARSVTGLPFADRERGTWDGFPQVGAQELCTALRDNDHVTIGDLHLTRDRVQPVDSTGAITLTTAPTLRAHVRRDPFRPLATATDLPRDWVVPVTAITDIPAIVETVYPGVLSRWHATRHNRAHLTAPTALAQRQPSMYGDLAQVSPATLARHVEQVCGQCIQHPAWHDHQLPADQVACPAPCNWFISTLNQS